MVEALYPVPEDWAKNALINQDTYMDKYQRSLDDPEGFWRDEAQRIDWIKPFSVVKQTSFHEADFGISWFPDGTLNLSANALDRHLAERGDQIAILWEPDDPKDPERRITYRQLHEDVCRFANLLKARGVSKGDRVTIYLPMVPEAAVAMLACARIGAIHSIVFAGFSPDALAGRITDCDSSIVLTADQGLRGGKRVALKANVDEALEDCPGVETVIVLAHTGADVPMVEGRDIDWATSVAEQSVDCTPEEMNAEDPLFILYTSGSTGKPKGVLHTTGGYSVWASMTHEYVFDYRPGQIYWCAADIGWVTGHSYVVYGPLMNGATTVMFEGVPSFPDASRFWQIVDKYEVEIFYGAPTALRALMREGDDYVKATSRKSLKVLGSVGEPINPEAWSWYYNVVGEGRCPIVDTWWQTETGGVMITPLPGATDLKPGSASKPMFGVRPMLLDNDGKEMTGAGEGCLVVADSWPGQMRTVWGDHERFFQTYFSTFKGFYFTGDGCRRDEDGYYWITGRIDDVINVSGHRMGTAEIESALVAHHKVAEAAVVGMPHEIKGQGIYAFVTTNSGVEADEDLRRELIKWVRHEIGPIATPDVIQFAPGLPKTRSGKIMRRILRKIGENDVSSLGDTSTLADPSVVDNLIENRPQPATA
ncbi:acetate--CoA ligase [Novosphingobium mangrovi (ex Hu et al. 2023)]|uniref:Acetyl-coenzyme A synthetase n=1 Tax=Novosphingobium mangrovi (ex Hu et al. 2023) TaxID=2930094 RepID=A0ABT0A9L5_9SPHN|nr:acetate--CoA ligase [Novosphingobium mangrovi (ex Hu et al. 2023)]MCJ1959884.1 acetate--CoA ligase [Novosphingobium mangrovi (ex Hu et al. 2023)]